MGAPADAPRILWVDEASQSIAEPRCVLRVRHPDWDVACVPSPFRAIAMLERHRIDVLVSDVSFNEAHGGSFLEWVARRDPGLPCLIVTARPDMARRSSLPRNVQRVLLKPADSGVLLGCLERALRLRRGLASRPPPAAAEAAPARAASSLPPRSAVACSAPLAFVARATHQR